ncbi:MGMT family protein, partial [Chloroflexota bacterium]
RAVGQALARNPLPIIIPCHRVLTSDGRLGGYRGGLEMKKHLLSLEASAASGIFGSSPKWLVCNFWFL